jgi:hypothetical protein
MRWGKLIGPKRWFFWHDFVCAKSDKNEIMRLLLDFSAFDDKLYAVRLV